MNRNPFSNDHEIGMWSTENPFNIVDEQIGHIRDPVRRASAARRIALEQGSKCARLEARIRSLNTEVDSLRSSNREFKAKNKNISNAVENFNGVKTILYGALNDFNYMLTYCQMGTLNVDKTKLTKAMGRGPVEWTYRDQVFILNGNQDRRNVRGLQWIAVRMGLLIFENTVL